MSSTSVAEAPRLEVAGVLAKSRGENFTVASRLLPGRLRAQLRAVYGFARLVDDVGDVAAGDRERQLDWVEAELTRAFEGRANHPIFLAVQHCVAEVGLDRRPFDDLVAANRQDQRVRRYPTYADLEAYCALSANPVGRLVLAILGRRDPLAVELSDRVCTGLQLVEHWQDVAEDLGRGRVYLPLEDLDRFEVTESQLAAPSASPAFRRLMAFEVGRARELLRSGAPLVGLLAPAGRVAVAGFLGGGLAQLEAIERHGYDVLAHRVKASKGAVAARAAALACGREPR